MSKCFETYIAKVSLKIQFIIYGNNQHVKWQFVNYITKLFQIDLFVEVHI